MDIGIAKFPKKWLERRDSHHQDFQVGQEQTFNKSHKMHCHPSQCLTNVEHSF